MSACPTCGHGSEPEMKEIPEVSAEPAVEGADSETSAKSEILDELIALMQQSVGKRLPKGEPEEV